MQEIFNDVKEGKEITEAAKSLSDLAQFRLEYYEMLKRIAAEKRGFSIFSGWFKTNDDNRSETHDSYIKEFERKIQILSGTLSELAAKDLTTAETYAKETVLLMLFLDCPVSDRAASYIPVIRCFAQALFPYISSENRRLISKQWLKYETQHHMLPNEYKMFLLLKNS